MCGFRWVNILGVGVRVDELGVRYCTSFCVVGLRW